MLATKLWLLLSFSNVVRCEMEAKIVGGFYGSISDFPSAVCLNGFCNPDANTYWVCGSSVLNQRILLTAAHCIHKCSHGDEPKMIAKAGSSDVSKNPQKRVVVRYKIHDEYDEMTMFYDIALVFLNRDLVYGDTVKRCVIPKSFPRYARGKVAGWGVVSEHFTQTVKLKYVDQELWPAHKCDKYLSHMPGTFCASSGSAKDYPFAGDSGSGLVMNKAQVIGLVSHRTDNKPELTYYTNVSYFYTWIRKNSYMLYCNERN